MTRVICCFAIIGAFLSPALAAPPATDADYTAQFDKHFHQRSAPVALNDIVSPELYDSHCMGASLDAMMDQSKLAKLGGDIAWGVSYQMISLNDMFRITGNPKYLEANLRLINAVLAVRDDRVGRKNFQGQALPAWGTSAYTKRRAVFLVHTGMIVYPMLDAIYLARNSSQVSAELKANLEKVLPTALESLHLHDRQWRDGPADDEGYYVGMGEEQVIEGKPQPANRLSAMGRALWTAWLITNDAEYRSKALAIGGYIKHRLTIADDGAYYWPYLLPEAPVTKPITINRGSFPGEDLSHATLTVSFPIMLAENHQVFSDEDMRHFAKTVTNGWGKLGNGVLFGNISASPQSNPQLVIDPAGWISLSAYDPAVKTHILPFYLNYDRPLRAEEYPQLLAH